MRSQFANIKSSLFIPLQSLCNHLRRLTTYLHVLSMQSVLSMYLNLRFMADSNPTLSASPFYLLRFLYTHTTIHTKILGLEAVWTLPRWLGFRRSTSAST
jgi:hypothetical protein